MKKTLLFLLLLVPFVNASDIDFSPVYGGFGTNFYMGFYGNGAPSGYQNPIANFRLDNTGAYTLDIYAKETHAGTEYAKLKIIIDNVTTTLPIDSATYKYYYITGNFQETTTGNHTINITFINDYNSGGYDRNAYITKLILHGNFNLFTNANANYERTEKIITMSYGLNSKNTPWNYNNEIIPMERFKLLQTEYMRIWIMDDYYWYNFTGWQPYKPDGSYDYTKLDSYMKTLLINVSATPFVSLVWCPYQFTSGGKYVTREHTTITDYEGCSDYMANVIVHFYDKCKNDWNYCGDFSKWYFGVYNEPDCGWTNTSGDGRVYEEWTGYGNPNLTAPRPYSRLFNLVYAKAKTRAPTAQIGGFTSCGYKYDRFKLFLQETNPDFVSYNTYTKNTEGYYKASNNLSALIRQIENKDLPIIITEHNMNGSWRPGADDDMKTQFSSVYMASALNWMIMSDTDIELFFETETGSTDAQGNRAFNMWYRSYFPKPSYYTRLWFVNNIRKGDTIIKTISDFKGLEVLGTKNGDDKILLLINKLNTTQIVNLTFNKEVKSLFRINDNTTIQVNGNNTIIILNGYDVNFYKVLEKSKLSYDIFYVFIAILLLLLVYNYRKKIKRFLR